MNLLSYTGLTQYTEKLNVIFNEIKNNITKLFNKIEKNEEKGFLQGRNLYVGSDLTLSGATYVNPIALANKINEGDIVTVSYNLDWAYQSNLQVKFIFYNDNNVEVFAAEEYTDASTTRKSMTVTADGDATKIAFWIGNGGYIKNIQIEIGEEATEYSKNILSNSELNTKMTDLICNEYQNITYNPGQYCISDNKLFRNKVTTSSKPTGYSSNEWELTNLVSELSGGNGLKYSISNVLSGRNITSPQFSKVCIILGCRGASDIHLALKDSPIGTGVWSITNNGVLSLTMNNDTVTVSSNSSYNAGIVFLYS